MPVLYKPFQSNLEDKKSGKKLFYPHVVRTEISIPHSFPKRLPHILPFLRWCEKYAWQSGDGDGAASSIVRKRQCGWFGNVPHGDECPWRGVETADEVSAAQATLTVRFQPTTTKNLDRTTATRSMVTGAKCARYDKLVSALVTADRLMIRMTSLVVAAMAEMMEKHRTRQYNLFLASREEI